MRLFFARWNRCFHIVGWVTGGHQSRKEPIFLSGTSGGKTELVIGVMAIVMQKNK